MIITLFTMFDYHYATTDNYSPNFSGKCLFCLNNISHDEIRLQTDNCTVICPHCFVDAVVNTTTIPESDFKNERIRRFGEFSNTFLNNNKYRLITTYYRNNIRTTNHNPIFREPINIPPNMEIRTNNEVIVVLQWL